MITVPKAVRDALGIEEGDQVVFHVEGNRAVLARTPDFLALAGTVRVPAAKRNARWDDVLRKTRAYIEEAVSAFVDTNILIRHLTGDPPAMAAQATSFLESESELLLADLRALASAQWRRSTKPLIASPPSIESIPRNADQEPNVRRGLTMNTAASPTGEHLEKNSGCCRNRQAVVQSSIRRRPTAIPTEYLKTRHGWALVEGKGKRPLVPPDDPRHPRHARHGPGPPPTLGDAA